MKGRKRQPPPIWGLKSAKAAQDQFRQSVHVTCQSCLNFIADEVGDGSGIGVCDKHMHEQENQPLLYPRVQRICQHHTTKEKLDLMRARKLMQQSENKSSGQASAKKSPVAEKPTDHVKQTILEAINESTAPDKHPSIRDKRRAHAKNVFANLKEKLS